MWNALVLLEISDATVVIAQTGSVRKVAHD